jgi:bifunctional DNA-binding transcriptional regulator/antitoxin component of YhaV-PrlF toxin-antitoxin module
MTTTISVTTKRQVVLPKNFCERKKIKPGTALRVTEVGEGLYVTPISEPTEAELKKVLTKAGSLKRPQAPEEEEMLGQIIQEYRQEKRRRR